VTDAPLFKPRRCAKSGNASSHLNEWERLPLRLGAHFEAKSLAEVAVRWWLPRGYGGRYGGYRGGYGWQGATVTGFGAALESYGAGSLARLPGSRDDPGIAAIKLSQNPSQKALNESILMLA
jgi:hypothetical protein